MIDDLFSELKNKLQFKKETVFKS